MLRWLWRWFAAPPCEQLCDEKSNEKLVAMRRLMRRHKVGVYIVLMQDEHLSEYVADADRRVRYISGFTGSAGFVAIGADWAELATDSRYHLIAERELARGFSLRRLGRAGVAPWDDALVSRAIAARVNVGVDPRFIDAKVAGKINDALVQHGLRLVAISENLVDVLWSADVRNPKPNLPRTEVFALGLDHTGKTAAEKLQDLRNDMKRRGAQTYVSYSLEDTAWLLNLRGGDVPYVPVFKSFIVVTVDRVEVYVDTTKFNFRDREGVRLHVLDYNSFFTIKVRGPVWVPGVGSWALSRQFRDLIPDMSPINLRKAIKNCAEIAGLREAQLKCSLSIVKYLAWLGEHIDEHVDEYSGGLKLLEIRETFPDFMGNSFETISAAGGNASMPHYAPTREQSAPITRDAVYLLDSGSQFLQGSTDITRTTHYGEPTYDEIRAYTLVLKGQLAVASSVFPQGTSGFKLDILARQFLWEEGLDYGHGTGHGIGSYLNIHELPLGIGMSAGPESVLVPGHFVSDEPGYYEDGKFGVRLESDILVVPKLSSRGREYYGFEVMTLVPFEPKLIDVGRLTPKELGSVNAYHAKCREYLMPYLTEDYERAWLERCTCEL